jgi:hypothetical protein
VKPQLFQPSPLTAAYFASVFLAGAGSVRVAAGSRLAKPSRSDAPWGGLDLERPKQLARQPLVTQRGATHYEPVPVRTSRVAARISGELCGAPDLQAGTGMA